jgi:hypothetical protein
MSAQLYPGVAGWRNHFQSETGTPPVVFGLRKEDYVRSIVDAKQPKAILEAAHTFTLAEINLFVLCRCDLRSISTRPDQARERDRLMSILLMDSEEVIGRDPLAQQLIERELKVRLLAERVSSRCRDHFFAT